jgi:hypothetical protein
LTFGSDSAYQIEIVFDWLVEKMGYRSNDPNLKLFRTLHSSYTPSKRPDYENCQSNCDSFAGKNKSEHVLVSQLNTV